MSFKFIHLAQLFPLGVDFYIEFHSKVLLEYLIGIINVPIISPLSEKTKQQRGPKTYMERIYMGSRKRQDLLSKLGA